MLSLLAFFFQIGKHQAQYSFQRTKVEHNQSHGDRTRNSAQAHPKTAQPGVLEVWATGLLQPQNKEVVLHVVTTDSAKPHFPKFKKRGRG